MPPDGPSPKKDPRRVEISDRVRLQHMLDAARQVIGFVKGRTRADLDTDAMLARAVIHAIQEIGEAASRISEATRTRTGGVPWTMIVGMRHRLVHVYWGINLNLVWEVASRDLEHLIFAIESATANWPLEEP